MTQREQQATSQREQHEALSGEIDVHLRRGPLKYVVVDQWGNYVAWYAKLLTTLAVLAHGDPVVYGHVDYEPSMSDVRVVVFTTSRVMVVELETEAHDAVPVVRVIPRRSLSSLDLSTSARIDGYKEHPDLWPGGLNLVATYPSLEKPIEIVGDGANPWPREKPSPLIELVRALTSDLGSNNEAAR